MSNQPTTNPTNTPTQGLSGIPYVGSKISLISRSGFKYEGTLYTIDTQKSTVALRDGRVGGDKVYDYIVFKGSDIKDLTVCEAPQQPFYQDPLTQQSPSQRERNPLQQPPMFPGYGGYQNMMPPNYNPYMSPYNPFYFPQMHPYMRNFSPMPQKTETKPEDELPFVPPMPQFGSLKPEQPEPNEIPKPTVTEVRPKEPTVPEKKEETLPPKKEEPKEETQAKTEPETKKEEEAPQQQVKWSEIHKQKEQKEKEEPHNRSYRRGRGRGKGRNRRYNLNYKSTTQGLNLGPVGTGQKFTEEFDFESNLKKFSKEEVEKELLETAKQQQQQQTETDETGLEKAVDLLGISEPKKKEEILPKKGYDKNQSFFDNISRDIKEPSTDRRKEREENYKRDIETFGPLTINHKSSRTEYRYRRPTNYHNRRAFDRQNTRGRRKFNQPSYQKIDPQEKS